MNLKVVQRQSRLVLVFVLVLFFLLSQLVTKLNVLVREMTHQHPEVFRRWGKFLSHFSFYSLRISFHCSQCCRLLMLAACFSLYCPIISSILWMANRQTLTKCVALALCHNLQCVHVGSWCVFFSFFLLACLCHWVCPWVFRGFQPCQIGQLVCTVQIRCTAGINGEVPNSMLLIS